MSEELTELRQQNLALTHRVKLLERENKFLEELNVRLMQAQRVHETSMRTDLKEDV
jgi:hypothetical protein